MRHDQGPDFFRLSTPGDVGGLGVPHAELLKGLVVLTVGEVHRRREPDVAGGHCLGTARSARSPTSASGCGYGSGRIITPLTTLKIVVVAPIPRASVPMAASAKPSVPAEHAGRESEVGRQPFEPADAVHLMDLLPNQERAPQLPPCSRVCRLRRHAGAHVSVDEQLEMGLELTLGFLRRRVGVRTRSEAAQHKATSLAHMSALRRGPQEASHHAGEALPVFGLHHQLLTPRLGERVELRLAVVLRRSPNLPKSSVDDGDA